MKTYKGNQMILEVVQGQLSKYDEGYFTSKDVDDFCGKEESTREDFLTKLQKTVTEDIGSKVAQFYKEGVYTLVKGAKTLLECEFVGSPFSPEGVSLDDEFFYTHGVTEEELKETVTFLKAMAEEIEFDELIENTLERIPHSQFDL